ncbi:Uma2 family endonuclease [Paenibacillus motobuensis]|uniref:Uma2 family endonuclease n=1 Tax=Paenibacillus motobuensis TaxID=295324 RepID=A0ABN0YPU1_9BACL
MGNEKNDKYTMKIKESQNNYIIEDRYEIIEGLRYDLLSSPKINHQILVSELSTSINKTCHTEGLILFAPLDVHLNEANILQPDIIFIRNENLHIIKDGYIKGAPDLLIEILSPSSGAMDKIKKKSVYERFGVQEYWIVDPHYATVDQFMLVDGKYQLAATYDSLGRIESPQLACLSIELSRMFEVANRFG